MIDQPSKSNRPLGLLRRWALGFVLDERRSPALRLRVQRLLARDPLFSDAYDRARQIERQGHRPIAASQVRVIEAALFEHDFMEGDVEKRPVTAWLARPALVPLVAAAGAIAVFIAVGTPPTDAAGVGLPDSFGGVSWTARGVSDAPRVGVRASCIDKDAQRVVDRAEAGPRAPEDVLRCPAGALLSLSMTNLEATPVYVYAIGVASNGALRFLAPFDETATSLLVEPHTVDRPLDVVADTSAFPAEDGFSLFALFSVQPLRGEDVARTLRAAHGRAIPVRATDRLPFDAFTARIELLR